MKGTNELYLNSATMCEALQEYFDKRHVGQAPKVTDITSTHQSGGYRRGQCHL